VTVGLCLMCARVAQRTFTDLIGDRSAYVRDSSELASRGLYLDVPEWKTHVFEYK
jgi:hypothetical protein